MAAPQRRLYKKLASEGVIVLFSLSVCLLMIGFELF